ncbi:hypothetical protein ACE7GA_02785 [Roseomonas sp. CCTCC AB2023176]|uniref:hypothetical protein n=1 Tax=Roseomonas sp. CCTCC AB2023176 TaxID=3342640 RepID=UPI0035E365B8
MLSFKDCTNIRIAGDEYTSGFLGLHWLPSAGAAANQSRYEADVIAGLNRLMKTFTGWAVINEVFWNRPRVMWIMPYHPTPATGPFNATAGATDLAAATMKDTTALDGKGALPKAGQARTIGTGAGSDTIISFTPGVFTAKPGNPTGPGTSGDEILLHEMVHGIRQMMGRSVREAVAGNPGMDNYEEFVAILVTNIFRSESGQTQMRQDHHGFVALSGAAANPATFKATYSAYLSYMATEQPRLCQNLRQVTCAFNPLI